MSGDSKRTPLRAIRVPDEIWDAARAVAAERDETVSQVVRRALKRYAQTHGTTGGNR